MGEQPEQTCSFSDARELNAKSLHLQEQILHVNDLVADQRLEEDTHQSHKPRLHELVLDLLACVKAVGDVQMNELLRQLDRCGEAVDDLH